MRKIPKSFTRCVSEAFLLCLFAPAVPRTGKKRKDIFFSKLLRLAGTGRDMFSKRSVFYSG